MREKITAEVPYVKSIRYTDIDLARKGVEAMEEHGATEIRDFNMTNDYAGPKPGIRVRKFTATAVRG